MVTCEVSVSTPFCETPMATAKVLDAVARRKTLPREHEGVHYPVGTTAPKLTLMSTTSRVPTLAC